MTTVLLSTPSTDLQNVSLALNKVKVQCVLVEVQLEGVVEVRLVSQLVALQLHVGLQSLDPLPELVHRAVDL